jgi:glycosyltransferase involved in cell wall biosynthesis
MLAGTPVIIADTGPARELVSDQESGILVPPDDPVALAQAVGRLVREPALRLSLGAAGERRVKNRFSVDACLSASVEFYRRVIGSPQWRFGYCMKAAHAK